MTCRLVLLPDPCLACKRPRVPAHGHYGPFCSRSCAADYAVETFEMLAWCGRCRAWDARLDSGECVGCSRRRAPADE